MSAVRLVCCSLLLLLSCTWISCVRGDLTIELVPSFGQKFQDVETMTFRITGPGLKEAPGSFDTSFSSGRASLPQLIVDPDAKEKWLDIQAYAYTDSEKITAVAASRFDLSLTAGQFLRVLMSRAEQFGWLTEFDTAGKSQLPFRLVGHRTVALPDGRIVLTGGTRYFREEKGLIGLRSSEDLADRLLIYDPQTGRLGFGPKLGTPRVFHTATLLDDGRVLIAGGIGFFNEIPAATGIIEIFDPKTNEINSSLPPIKGARAFHTAVQMPDKSIIFIGGIGKLLDLNNKKDWRGQQVLGVDRFVPDENKTEQVLQLDDADGRFLHCANAFENNTILVTGGMRINGDSSEREALKRPLIIQNGTQGWRVKKDLPGETNAKARFDHTTVKVRDGDNEWVILTGGRDVANATVGNVEVWSKEGKLVSFTERLRQPRYGHAAFVLPDLQILLMGGIGSDLTRPMIQSELISYTTSGGSISLKSPQAGPELLETKGRYRLQVVQHPHSLRIFLFGGATLYSSSNTKEEVFLGQQSVEFYTPKITPKAQ